MTTTGMVDAVFNMRRGVLDARAEIGRIARALETLGMAGPATILHEELAGLNTLSEALVTAHGLALGEHVRQAEAGSRNLLVAYAAGAGVDLTSGRKLSKPGPVR